MKSFVEIKWQCWEGADPAGLNHGSGCSWCTERNRWQLKEAMATIKTQQPSSPYVTPKDNWWIRLQRWRREEEEATTALGTVISEGGEGRGGGSNLQNVSSAPAKNYCYELKSNTPLLLANWVSWVKKWRQQESSEGWREISEII